MPNTRPARQQARHPALRVTLVCLFVLLSAQALIGVLSFTALEDLMRDTTADQMEVAAHRIKSGIETGLFLGKPLAQFFGLAVLLAEDSSRKLSGISVVLPDGEPVASLGDREPGASPSGREALLAFLKAANERKSPAVSAGEGLRTRPSGAALMVLPDRLLLATPLKDASGHMAGVLMLAGDPNASVLKTLVAQNLRALFLITCLAILILSIAFRFLGTSTRARFFVPLLTLILAQGAYALYTISGFRAAWLEVVHQNVDILAENLGKNLDRVLAYGFTPGELRAVEAPLSRLARAFPIVEAIDLTDADGKLLSRADANGKAPATAASFRENGQDLSRTLLIGAAEENPAAHGRLVFHLNEKTIAREVRNRALDALTVALVSLVAAIEMLLIAAFLVNRGPRASPSSTEHDAEETAADSPGRLIRPIVFGLLFVWALPLGFLPLYARHLATTTALPQNLLLSLPIVLEMGGSLVAALLAGWLAERKGWRVPVLSGFVLFPLAMLACAFSGDLYRLTLARAAIGVAYGLAWMGAYSFVILQSPAARLGRNITNLVAGIYAGHLTGVAVGAMLVDRLGFRPVFLAGAALMLPSILGALLLARAKLSAGAPGRARVPPTASPALAVRPGEILRLFRDKGFGLLLLGSVIPASLIQTGLISFALPLYLASFEVQTADVGRILVLYGLCLTYAGPLAGRLSDRLAASRRVSRKESVN